MILWRQVCAAVYLQQFLADGLLITHQAQAEHMLHCNLLAARPPIASSIHSAYLASARRALSALSPSCSADICCINSPLSTFKDCHCW